MHGSLYHGQVVAINSMKCARTGYIKCPRAEAQDFSLWHLETLQGMRAVEKFPGTSNTREHFMYAPASYMAPCQMLLVNLKKLYFHVLLSTHPITSIKNLRKSVRHDYLQ